MWCPYCEAGGWKFCHTGWDLPRVVSLLGNWWLEVLPHWVGLASCGVLVRDLVVGGFAVQGRTCLVWCTHEDC